MDHTIIEILGFIGVFALVYTFSDAWHDEKVINNIKFWHQIDAFIKGLVSFMIGFVVWWFTNDILLLGIIFLGILLIRASLFNIILNKLMGWPGRHRKKTGFDLIPTYVWWLLLTGLIIFTYFNYKDYVLIN